MHTFKTISFWFVLFLLSVSLVLALVTTPVSTRLTDRQSLKNWVSSPEVLEGVSEIVPTVLSEAFEDEEGIEISQFGDTVIAIDLDPLMASTSDVLTTEYLTTKLNPVIDGLYDWLEGKTDSPEFEIVLSDRLTALSDAISEPLKNELAKLPVCSNDFLYSSDFNPIEAVCVPSGVDAGFIVDEFTSQVTTSPDIADISFSSDDLDLDEDILTAVPRFYSGVKNLPYAFAVAVALLSIAVVLLAKSFRRGLDRLSWVLMASGLLLALSFWILGSLKSFVSINAGDSISDLALEKIIEPLAVVVLGDIAQTGLLISLSVAAVGAVLLLSSYTHRKIRHEQKESSKITVKNNLDDASPTEQQETRYINKISKKK